MFSAIFRHHDPIFRTTSERNFSNENPYEILWGIFYDRDLREAANGEKRVTIRHDASGETIVVTVDFDGLDDDGFSAPVVKNEARFDAFCRRHGFDPGDGGPTAQEPSEQEPALPTNS